ncbi:MAG TPA: hypothetical protein VHY75_17145 [Steroidobacteraceae bacterium]|nr:hypothetical protein [Steroidobacteraceae bacterium]
MTRSTNLPLFWFLAGVLSTLAALTLMLPWLRTIPRLGPLPSPSWQAGACAVIVLSGAYALYHWLGRPDLAAAQPLLPSLASMPPLNAAAATSPAGSMSSAITGLRARLAKGGGTPDDWELLAKSYDFLGLPAAASEARAHRLPAVSPDGDGDGGTVAAAAAAAAGPLPGASTGAVVHGEVSLAQPLRTRAAAAAALFIVAKSTGSPGPPVAVFRTTAAEWPIEFTLDDSQSMLPGRNLSSAGRITVEARISQSGQAMPAPGDLVGTSGVIDPAEHRPLAILIDRVMK